MNEKRFSKNGEEIITNLRKIQIPYSDCINDLLALTYPGQSGVNLNGWVNAFKDKTLMHNFKMVFCEGPTNEQSYLEYVGSRPKLRYEHSGFHRPPGYDTGWIGPSICIRSWEEKGILFQTTEYPSNKKILRVAYVYDSELIKKWARLGK